MKTKQEIEQEIKELNAQVEEKIASLALTLTCLKGKREELSGEKE